MGLIYRKLNEKSHKLSPLGRNKQISKGIESLIFAYKRNQ